MRGAQVSARQALCPGLSRAWKGAPAAPSPPASRRCGERARGLMLGLTETLTGVRAFLVSILRCAAAIADSLMSRLETVCRRAGLLACTFV